MNASSSTTKPDSLSIGEYIFRTTRRLAQAGIGTGRLDTLILLEDQLQRDRAYILAHPEDPLRSDDLDTLEHQIAQRVRHVPLAYIRGYAAFYGRRFTVSPEVLVPRPESEAMIDILKSLSFDENPCIADIGTGSGALGITAALEIPTSCVMLTDVSNSALRVAGQNAKRHNATVILRQSDLLQDIERPLDIVLANLPYVPHNYPINEAARHEPGLALFSGTDGLDHYRAFWAQLAAQKIAPQHVCTESLLEQHDDIIALAEGAGFRHMRTEGLVQYFAR